MLRNPYLWIALLILWMLFSYAMFYPNCCVGGGGATTTNTAAGNVVKKVAPLLIADGAAFNTRSEANFTFARSGAKPNIPSATQNAFRELANYLKKNPTKKLTITGRYTSTEKNTSSQPTLGLGRADAIKQQLVSLGAGAAGIAIADRLENNLSFDKDLVLGSESIDYSFGVNAAATPPAASNAGRNLVITDNTGDTFTTSAPANLIFDKSGYEFKTPIDANVSKSYKASIAHLKKFPNKTLTLTGLYAEGEDNPSIYPNLGLARANKVKQQLVNMGAKGNQIIVDSRKTGIKFNNNQVIGGINYVFANTTKETKDANANKLAKLEKDLKAKPRNIYFETNKDKIIMDAELRQYFSDLMYYLSQKPNAGITVTGHTDSDGAAAANKSLAKRRADFVKKYLTQNGLRNKQMSTDSKGEEAPIADNKTAAGKAKNRRVEIRLK